MYPAFFLRRARKALKPTVAPAVDLILSDINSLNSHQCGTIRFGTDPTKSVLDVFGRRHNVPNLFVVDSSFFPSSVAVNPALTIAAQAFA